MTIFGGTHAQTLRSRISGFALRGLYAPREKGLNSPTAQSRHVRPKPKYERFGLGNTAPRGGRTQSFLPFFPAIVLDRKRAELSLPLLPSQSSRKWGGQRDSNPRPQDSQSCALTN